VDVGQCDDNVLAWYFDHSSEQCRNFTYSGCGGNDNRYETEEKCVSQCMWITADGKLTPSVESEIVLWCCIFTENCVYTILSNTRVGY